MEAVVALLPSETDDLAAINLLFKEVCLEFISKKYEFRVGDVVSEKELEKSD